MVNRTDRDLLLLVAFSLGYGKEFTIEELCVRAWELYPSQFSLEGFPKYPDSHKINSDMAGEKKVARKFPRYDKVGRKKYKLTDYGSNAAAAMTNGENFRDETCSESMPMIDEKKFLHTLNCSAFHLYQQGLRRSIVLHEALEWFDESRQANQKSLQSMDAFLKSIHSMTLKTPIQLSDGMEVSESLVLQMRDCNDFITTAFHKKIGA